MLVQAVAAVLGSIFAVSFWEIYKQIKDLL